MTKVTISISYILLTNGAVMRTEIEMVTFVILQLSLLGSWPVPQAIHGIDAEVKFDA